MKNKLFYKIFLNYVFIFFIISVLFMVISLNIARNVNIKNMEEILKNISFLIDDNIKQFIKTEKYIDVDSYIKKVAKNFNIKITIIKNDGVVIADSERPKSEIDNNITLLDIQMTSKNKTKNSKYSSIIQNDVLFITKKFHIENTDRYYFIRIGFDLKTINDGFTNLRNKILLALTFIFLIFIVFIYFNSKKLYKPVEDLIQATKKIAQGDFEHRVVLYENNEYKDLVDNFNMMVLEIKKLFTQLKEKQEQLKTIISSIDEGIMVIEESGKIIFVNNKFNEIVNNTCVDSKFYWEFLLPPELIKIIETTKNYKKTIFENINIKNKIFLCHTNYLEEYREVITILYEISKIKELEKIKKDLVANVSHEIKTPLTAIKGFTETAMEETKDKKIIHYLEIINNNTQRLINIVEDLLILSNLEQENKKLQLESINLNEMLQNILKLFVKKLKTKNLLLNITINEVPIIIADKFMFEQMFINLIDNAIKYTDKGEITINIYRKDKTQIIIEISDTGIGIAEEHIPRIFDRFYVVDKSRSKETGGTGLGLSIVKHIVSLHNGEILVDSKPGKGTKFIIILPDKKT